ncbi:MAG TPA: MoxR family ATPase [Candidatus Acidoferrales bacterium]|jgi:MoxR-like ATPase|nr:MoxR family ATPase [Candidatus Acidoferrales bacterium]
MKAPGTSITATATSSPISQLQRAVARVIRGKDDAIDLALVALLGRGHLLIEDVPGVGKTTLAQALAHSFHCSFQRIQFTSDMLPSDVVGISVFNQAEQQFEFKPGPIFANIVLADEINRTTPKTQSALLEAMNEAQVTVDAHTHALPQPFMVLATQNPIEHHGTYPLPESQLDRFLVRIRMGYPSRETEKEILRNRADAHTGASVQPVIEASDVLTMQQAVSGVRVDDSLLDYALEIIEKTRQNERLILGVSPRGSLMLQRAAQARAFIEGRDFCLPDDFKQLILPVFAHRVVVNARYATTQKKIAQAEAILSEIIESTPVPL